MFVDSALQVSTGLLAAGYNCKEPLGKGGGTTPDAMLACERWLWGAGVVNAGCPSFSFSFFFFPSPAPTRRLLFFFFFFFRGPHV